MAAPGAWMDGFDQRLSGGFERMHRDLRLQLYWLLGFVASGFRTVVGLFRSIASASTRAADCSSP